MTLKGYQAILELPVQWGDQDALGHVNNVIAFRWLESSRIAWLEQSGIYETLEGLGCGSILASVQADYRRQLHYPDSVRIGARLERLGRSSLTLQHRVLSTRLQDTAIEGLSVIVAFNYGEQTAVPWTPAMRTQLESFGSA